MRHFIPIGGHEICSGNRTKHTHILICPMISHHSHRLHCGQKHSERLADFVIMPTADQLFNVNRICSPKLVRIISCYFPDNADSQTWTWKRMAHDGVVWQSKFTTQSSNLILEQE